MFFLFLPKLKQKYSPKGNYHVSEFIIINKNKMITYMLTYLLNNKTIYFIYTDRLFLAMDIVLPIKIKIFTTTIITHNFILLKLKFKFKFHRFSKITVL